MEELKTEVKINQTEEVKAGPGMVKPLVPPRTLPKIDLSRKLMVILAGVVVLGLISGYGFYAWKTAGTVRLAGRDVEVVATGTEEGVKDASTFRDTATGTLAENDGKITKEGTHVLVRGDTSQNVYLTSSVVDMSKYVGKKVQVWGETFKGQTAGWLMDVGRIKVVQ